MKINELLNEALPGVKSQNWFSRLFNRPDAQIKASIDQGTKAWIAFAKNLASQGKITTATLPPQYAEIFKLWSANAMNLPPKHPDMVRITQELAAELTGDNSEKPIKNAVTKLVNLSQTLAAAGPEARYTPEMKAQAILTVIDKYYGKFFKDLQSKIAVKTFIEKTVKDNPDKSVDELKSMIEANIAQFASKKNKKNKGGGAGGKDPNNIPVGAISNYTGGPYKWANDAWRDSAGVALTGTDVQAATQDWMNQP